ncbi:unnamed protein product, partial [Amoebophrya sp. A25]
NNKTTKSNTDRNASSSTIQVLAFFDTQDIRGMLSLSHAEDSDSFERAGFLPLPTQESGEQSSKPHHSSHCAAFLQITTSDVVCLFEDVIPLIDDFHIGDASAVIANSAFINSRPQTATLLMP